SWWPRKPKPKCCTWRVSLFPRKTARFSVRPSSSCATAVIAWERTSWRPLSRSGKKGLPRLEHDLPTLPASLEVRGLSCQDLHDPVGRCVLRTRLLPLQALRSGSLSLGRGVVVGRATLHARRS